MNKKRNIVVAAVTCFLLIVGSGYAEDSQLQILTLARDGENLKAITLFETLKNRTDLPADVLRAVAGCYWRERRFDDARLLYRRILERQPNLRPIASSTQKPLIAVPMANASEPVQAEEGGGANHGSSAIEQELDALQKKYRDSESEREQMRHDTDVRIANLSEQAASRVKEITELRELLEAERDRPPVAEKKEEGTGEQLTPEIGASHEQIEVLRQEVDAAETAYANLQAEMERKLDDLLDALASEKKMREVDSNALRTATTAFEKRKTAMAAELMEMHEKLQAAEQNGQARETELMHQVELLQEDGKAALSQKPSTDPYIQDMQRRLDELSALLALRDLELSQQIARVEQQTIDMALAEIERLEQEYAVLATESSKREMALTEQMAALKAAGTAAEVALAEITQERDDERQKRLDLEQQVAGQSADLQHTTAMLNEATAALSRQYDAIREQVQDGGVIRLEGGVTNVADSSLPAFSSDLEPLIGRLDAATASATAEVQQLRRQLEQERVAFTGLSSESEKEKAAIKDELAVLKEQFKELTIDMADGKSNAAVTQARLLQAMKMEYDQLVTKLNGEMNTLREELASRNSSLLTLESDLEGERENLARVLSMALENEEVLGKRIQELEAALALSTVVAPNAPREGETESTVAASSREILAMIPNDPSGAISRFEAFPSMAEISDTLLKAIGNLYREQRQYEQALRVFETILEKSPEDAYTERKLVMTLFDMGRYDQALDRLTGAVDHP